MNIGAYAPRQVVPSFEYHNHIITNDGLPHLQAPPFSKILVSGYVRGFDDTQSQADDFADYLAQNNHVGLWYNPASRFDTFLFYSRNSRAWDFLDDAKVQHTPTRWSDSRLRFALHLHLPSLNILRQTSSFRPLADAPLSPVAAESRPPTRLSTPRPSTRDYDNDNVTSNNSKAIPPAPLQVSPNLQGAELKKYFQDHYKISFSRLSYLPNTPTKASVFFLCFPSEVSDELDLVKRYLSLHQVGVYSTNSVDDWNNFRLTTEKMGGVILVCIPLVFLHLFLAHMQQFPSQS